MPFDTPINHQDAYRVLADAVEILDAGFLLCDRDGNLHVCNKAFKDIYPELAENLVAGRVFAEILTSAYQNLPASGRTCSQSEWVQKYEREILEPNIVRDYLHGAKLLRVSKRRTKEGGLVCLVTDLTERKSVEDDLRQARDAAESANRAKAEFLAVMSHEVRTPLNGVMGFLSLLLDSDLSDEQRNFARMAYKSSEGLLSVINDILDFSKIDAGKLDVEQTDFSPSSLINDIVTTFQTSAQLKGIHLSLENGFPCDRYVCGDPARIRQIFNNLVSNAIKFTKKGGVRIVTAMKMSSLPGQCQLYVEIHDTGLGIPENALEKIFDAFTQADSSTTRRFGGTGLGLAICKRLVSILGGQIGVQSRQNEGSKFWFEIPLEIVDRAPIEIPSEARLSSVKFNLRIILAEDNEINRIVAVRMLERMGCRVRAVSDGNEVLRALETSAYDLVILDCQMPGIDGYETAIQIRKGVIPQVKEIPIIAMTADAIKEDRERCLACGMNEYLSKPIHPEKLIAVLTAYSGEIKRTKKRQSAEPHLPVIDLNQVSVLRAIKDPGLIPDLVKMFEENVSASIVKIERAIKVEDRATLQLEAHRVKSTTANMGAARLSQLLENLELLSQRSRSRGEFAELLDRIKSEFAFAKEMLAEEVHSGPS